MTHSILYVHTYVMHETRTKNELQELKFSGKLKDAEEQNTCSD